ncbi:MAG TPA: hypothetical protein VH186_30385 [Chloroflexia bacterium]|nr:hypothetical protein [Chloroflexia bacterium]
MENNPPSPEQPSPGGQYPPPWQPSSNGFPSPYGYPPPGQNVPPPGGVRPDAPPYYQQGPYVPPPNAPGFGPPSGYYPYPPPPPPRKKGIPAWGWLILAVAIVAVLACAGIVALVVGVGVSTKSDGEKVLDQFMRAAAVRDIDKLYSLSTNTDRQSFEADVTNNLLNPYAAFLPNYRSLNSGLSFEINIVNGISTMKFSGKIDYGQSGSGTYDIELQKVGEQWKVVYLHLQPPSSGTSG